MAPLKFSRMISEADIAKRVKELGVEFLKVHSFFTQT
jgi:hypothetical protein